MENEIIKIKGGKLLKGISIDANSIPDLLPALAVLATQATGKTDIYNVKQARMKETDRIHSMMEGLTRLGAKIIEHEDGMTIYQSNLVGTNVQGYADHRTVMALIIAGMLAKGKTIISDGEAINKTFPEFISVMQSLGAEIEINKLKESKHIILVGFKHVGKTSIGKQLALVLQKKFIDLDEEIENAYQSKHGQFLTCRQIMQQHGEKYYRSTEKIILEKILLLPSAILALGGGTLLDKKNQQKVKSHFLLHINAPPGVIFERIMVTGWPAFFDFKEEPYEFFSYIWKKREKIYKKLTSYIVNNHGSINDAIKQATICLEKMGV